MPHFVHDAVRAAAQLADALQVVGLHLEILPGDKTCVKARQRKRVKEAGSYLVADGHARFGVQISRRAEAHKNMIDWLIVLIDVCRYSTARGEKTVVGESERRQNDLTEREEELVGRLPWGGPTSACLPTQNKTSVESHVGGFQSRLAR